MQQERRQSERHPLHFQLEIMGIDQAGNRFQEQSQLIDISGGGAKFSSDQPNRYHRGQVVDARILLPDRTGMGASMATSAVVLRMEDRDDNRQVQVAVQFLDRLTFNRRAVTRPPDGMDRGTSSIPKGQQP